jgi:flagellar biosynthesis/type III secretory pathway ATPase
MDKELKITDRQIAYLREEISRVQRQVQLIKQGEIYSGDKDRMDIAVDCCKEIDRVLCEL